MTGVSLRFGDTADFERYAVVGSLVGIDTFTLEEAVAMIDKHVGPIARIAYHGPRAIIYPAMAKPGYWHGQITLTGAHIQGDSALVRAIYSALKPDSIVLARIEGGLVGLLVGDALGVPYEFKYPNQLPPEDTLDFSPPEGFPRSHPTVEPGSWSDDGAQALCLLESLLHCGRFEPDDFGKRLVRWYKTGHLAVGGYVFDVGIQTLEAIRAIAAGTPVLDAARRDVDANGNGALMRVLPLALWHVGSDDELVRNAMQSSVVTHGHLRSQLCCALYCLWVRRILDDAESPWIDALTSLRAILASDQTAVSELEHEVQPNAAPTRPGSGYVVDTLRSVRGLAERGDYEIVVRGAVSLGFDTDTTAAVAGGLAGVRDGIHLIPQRWRDALRGRELLAPLLGQLLTHRANHIALLNRSTMRV